MKRIVRVLVRKILMIKENETIVDGIDRHFAHFKRTVIKRKISLDQFEMLLAKAGITPGDTLIVHCSWRNCFMIKATPEEAIQSIKKVLTDEGTLLMPCYPYNYENFDVRNDPSAAGVLSEVFRKMPNTLRSSFPKGTMCGQGKYAKEILESHILSRYQFDENSPYYRAIVEHDAKILLLGMGKLSHKITAFHCGAYDSKSYNSRLKETYSLNIQANITFWDGTTETISFVDRNENCHNNNRKFRKLFKEVKRKTIKNNSLVMVCFDGADAMGKAYDYCKRGKNLYSYS